MSQTFVIAEAGSCHDGQLKKALRLIEAAREIRVDAIKFQFWSNADRLADRRRVPEHYREIYRRYRMPAEWLAVLHGFCVAEGIEFMCSTYLPEDVAVVAPFVRHFKVASFEAEDSALLAAHAPFLTDRRLIISCGMDAYPRATVMRLGFPDRVRYLHCVSAYPAPVDALNFRVLCGFDGFSDHTDPALTWTGALAVAAMASSAAEPIIEAHLRLDDTDAANPDAPHAMTQGLFADYVRHIRFAEACLGAGVKQLQPCEREMAQYRVPPS